MKHKLDSELAIEVAGLRRQKDELLNAIAILRLEPDVAPALTVLRWHLHSVARRLGVREKELERRAASRP